MSDDKPKDRHAYLEEQIERQKRGEPIDVEWARAELERVRQQQAAVTASMQRNLRLLVVLCAVLLLVLWFKRGGFDGPGGVVTFGFILVGGLTAWVLGTRRRR